MTSERAELWRKLLASMDEMITLEANKLETLKKLRIGYAQAFERENTK